MPTMDLMSSLGGSSANPSLCFALSSLMSITEEQVEALDYDEPMLVVNKIK